MCQLLQACRLCFNMTGNRFSQPHHYSVIARLANSGNTYGSDLRIKFDCPTRDTSGPAVADPFTLGTWKNSFAPPSMLGPRQRPPLLACEFKPEEIADAQNNRIQIYFLSEVSYIDAFDEPRITQMTRHLLTDSSGGYSFGFTGRNCVDKGCPTAGRGRVL